MINSGIVYSEDFEKLGHTLGMLHGTSTKQFGNLSQIRDHDGLFEGQYVRYLNQFGLPLDTLVIVPPVKHSANVARITKKSGYSGLSYVNYENGLVEINIFDSIAPPGMTEVEQYLGFDAILTNSSNTFLGLAHADCTPLFLSFPRERVVAMVHVGILGFLADIIKNTFASALEWFKVHPRDAIAYIGPCISATEYNVRKSGMWELVLCEHMSENEAVWFDLKGAIRDRLLNLGVIETRILTSDYCTATNADLFFSNHRTPPELKETLGRNLSLIGRVTA